MKYRLNLYTDHFRPKHLYFDRRMLGASLGLVSLMLVVSALWLHWINRDLADEYNLLSTNRAQLETRMMALTKNVESKTESQEILKAIAGQSRAITGKRRLINRLANNPLLAETRFSNLMQGLSSSHLEGLWLTRVRADGENFILDGCSLSEDLVPKWIHQLSMQDDFRGKKFGLLELSRPRDDKGAATPHLDFHLSTKMQREAAKNG